MSDPFRTRWYYASSDDAEQWFVGGDTREEAIAAGRDDYEGEAFAISAGTPMRHALEPFTDDVDGVICAFQNANEDLFGEDGQGDPETEWTDTQCRDLAARLNATFADWAKEHGHDKAYMLDLSVGETIVPEDSDSDGSPEGGDGEAGSVRSTTARAEGIAQPGDAA